MKRSISDEANKKIALSLLATADQYRAAQRRRTQKGRNARRSWMAKHAPGLPATMEALITRLQALPREQLAAVLKILVPDTHREKGTK